MYVNLLDGFIGALEHVFAQVGAFDEGGHGVFDEGFVDF